MTDCMTFPNDWHEFLKFYSFEDYKKIYTNGSRLISVFRVEQLIEHLNAQKRAYWVEENDREHRYRWHCSNCGHVQGIASLGMKYCPECGYEMKHPSMAASGCERTFSPGKDE